MQCKFGIVDFPTLMQYYAWLQLRYLKFKNWFWSLKTQSVRWKKNYWKNLILWVIQKTKRSTETPQGWPYVYIHEYDIHICMYVLMYERMYVYIIYILRWVVVKIKSMFMWRFSIWGVLIAWTFSWSYIMRSFVRPIKKIIFYL